MEILQLVKYYSLFTIIHKRFHPYRVVLSSSHGCSNRGCSIHVHELVRAISTINIHISTIDIHKL